MNSIPNTPGCSGKSAGWLHISGVEKIQRCFPRIPGKFSMLINTLGLVINMIVLWNTIYIQAALAQLRGEGCMARYEDVARLSPLILRTHPCSRAVLFLDARVGR
jgi:hypothetical protein